LKSKCFVLDKLVLLCLCGSVILGLCAGIAQLVECKLPKLEVASSNLVARSIRVRPDDLPDSLTRM
jgi:hypothetical protein